jgi:hypothetical protein
MNAKQEFLEHIEGKKLVCVKIGIEKDYDNTDWHYLKDDYTEQDFNNFCAEIDFEYDDGCGGQELYGVILFTDSYSDRGEYDGSEWWENHKMPIIQEVLNPVKE